ncbi:pectin lyase-like protein [Microthyrium microscopicum]|uniref:pectinesterase n=1 Tax=Microthyrium microscopicum TaxID=703497 RepID=A0A6A6U5B6_9PEZI|nr:pectin lyase-like protein [Microthyrium microscopicum]
MRTTVAATLLLAVADTLALTTFPANEAKNVNPDTHLVLNFASPPKIGKSGIITVYDAATKAVVDTLDLSIPVSPAPNGRDPTNKGTTTQPKAADPNDKTPYQINMVGGYDFHFFPIVVHGNNAIVNLHNNKLKYGKQYIVKMEPSVLSADGFSGFTTDSAWTFTTKAAAPLQSSTRVVVAEDGSGDFSTVQGAIDWAPAKPTSKLTIFIKNGNYEEIVFMSKKSNIIIRGEDRNKTIVGYPNNSAFNPSKGGPSRRVAFTISNSNDIQLSTFTINNYFIGQAEAILIRGDRILLERMTMHGSGDAFTTYGTIYVADSLLTGDGDTVLGYGAVYWLRSTIESVGPFTWTRTPAGQHGNVFVNCSLVGVSKPLPWTVTAARPNGEKTKAVFARLPQNGKSVNGSNFPHAEMVLINTKTTGVPAEGWGPIQGDGFDKSDVKLWEFNTMDMSGKPVDMSKRNPVAKQLSMAKDAKLIEDYQKPDFVLKGWNPVIEK